MKTGTFYAKITCSIISIFILISSFAVAGTNANINNSKNVSPYVNMKVKRAFIK
jgi:hypothetical protein